MWTESSIDTDVLIIGGGIAGCMAAISARSQGLDVLVVDKVHAGKSGASIHADIFMTVFEPEWGADFDTCVEAWGVSGEFINNREWCETILKDSRRNYKDMVSWGVEFPPDVEAFANYFPPFTGTRLKHRKLSPALRRKAETDGVNILDRIMIVDLLKAGDTVVGAVGFCMDREELYVLRAKATVLAAGSNSFKGASEMAALSGDGDAMSYRAGGEITGKEFGSTTFPSLATYTSWSRAAHGMVNPAYPVLTDIDGSPLSAIHVEGEIEQEWGLGIEKLIHAGKGPFFWDTTKATDQQLEFIRTWQNDTHSPKEIEWSRQVIDPYSRQKLQLAGGYAVGFSNVGSAGTFVYNLKCETILPGLFAAGDCGGTRHNGSYNTNPGLGTAPAAATGRRAGLGAAEFAKGIRNVAVDREAVQCIKERIFMPLERNTGFTYHYVTRLLRDFMTPYFVTLIKDGTRLKAVLSIVEFLKEQLVPHVYANDNHELRMALETENMALNAEMMLRASLYRTESRGVHYREDYPAVDNNNWLAWTKLKNVEGVMTASKEPVPPEWWSETMTKHLKKAHGEDRNVH